MIQKLDLEKQIDQHPLTLSKGQRLRCAFGGVLTRNPELLIMDEPTSGQDISHINEIVRLLNEFPKMTVLCSSHDIDFIIAYATRIILIDMGQIVFDEINTGQKDEILKRLSV